MPFQDAGRSAQDTTEGAADPDTQAKYCVTCTCADLYMTSTGYRKRCMCHIHHNLSFSAMWLQVTQLECKCEHTSLVHLHHSVLIRSRNKV